MLHRPTLAACLAGTVLLAIVPALAQSFAGFGPIRSFVLPTEPRGTQTPASAIAPAAPEPARAEPPRQDELRRLPATLRGFRFAGEWAQTDWPVYLTAAQARRTALFQVAFLSAISVMPEGSRLTLTINDRVVAQTALAAPDAIAQRSFDLPPGLLVEGFNAIRITVEQRHRVDCSPAATYELWTALDPVRSGLVLAGAEQPAEIAAIAPRADGAAAIRLVTTGKLTPESAGRAIRAVQLAALAGRTLHPAVEFTSGGGKEAGLDLIIGTAEELRGRPDMADLGAVTGPRHGFLPARPDRPATFVVTGNDAAELAEALKSWEAENGQARSEIGSPAGLRALAALRGVQVDGGGEHIAFSRTGFADTEFSGRLMRLGLDITLPADFLPADYDRMILSLAGNHGGALTGDANVTVEINGRNAATQMLARNRPESLDRNQIFLPLGLMRPGTNRIDVVAQLPKPDDEACALSSSREPRLRLLDRSELILPRLARIGRAPELSLLAAGALPFIGGQARPILFVPTPDRASMAAAATLAARLAVTAGRPIDFAFTMTAPSMGGADVLLVGPAPTLERGWLRAAGLDPDRIKAAWQPGSGLRRQAPALSEADALARRCSLPPAMAQTVSSPGTPPEPASGLAALGLRASLPALSFWQPAPSPGAGTEDEVISTRAALLVGQDHPAEDNRHLWTVVTAPDSTTLQAGVQCLTHPQIWSGLNGRVSALASDETMSFVPAGERQHFVSTQGYGLANLRLVAAGWLSLNPLVYVSLALVMVLCLAASTLWLVVNSGRRQE